MAFPTLPSAQFESMTSREIAELTGKAHSHVMRDIRSMIKRIEAAPSLDWHCETETYTDAQGREREQYRISKHLVLTLISVYDTVSRFKIFERIEITNIRDLIAGLDVADLHPDQFIYVAMERQSHRYKVGISKNPEQRVKNLSNMHPEGLVLLAVYEARRGRLSESIAHQHLSEWRLNGEWFASDAPVQSLVEVL